MTKQEFTAIRIKADLETLALIGNRGRNQSSSAFFTQLLADGLCFRFQRQNFRPPKPLLDRLTAEEIFVLYGQWCDAVQTALKLSGPLGNRYEFAAVSEGLDYAEPGKVTFLPVEVGSRTCKIQTEHGEFPIFIESMQGLNFDPLPADQIENLKNWAAEG